MPKAPAGGYEHPAKRENVFNSTISTIPNLGSVPQACSSPGCWCPSLAATGQIIETSSLVAR